MTAASQFRRVLPVAVFAAALTGCASAPPLPPVPVSDIVAVAADWLDAIVPAGQEHLFAGADHRVVLARTDDAVALTIHPMALAAPRLTLRADPPTDPPLRFAPRWSDLFFVGLFSRPYRIVVRYPQLGGPGSNGRREVLDYGITEYYMPTRPPDQPHRMPFDSEIFPHTSPLHLVLVALGPLPPGRTRILAFHKSGVDYWATIDADGDRRELRFPFALLWADWSDRNLAQQSVFRVQSVAAWPDATIEVEQFGRLSHVKTRYERSRPIESDSRARPGG